MIARALTVLLGVAALVSAASRAGAQDGAGASTSVSTSSAGVTEAQLMLTQLYTDDDLTDRHLSYSEVRGLLTTDRLFGVRSLGLHFDGRFRKGWNALSADFGDVVRAYAEYGDERTFARFALGRLVLPEVAAARVDGARLAFRLAPGAQAGVFGGLSPHPITGAVDPRFMIGGAGYEVRRPTFNHAGGAVLQLFSGDVDRVYLTERAYVLISPAWLVYGMAIVDLVPPRGLIGDLARTATEEQSAIERIDLTNAFVLLRFKPSPVIDFSLSGHHFHTIIPNRWWQDWIEAERARRGFIVDGFDPVGTRRSSARLVTNLHLGDLFTPYLTLRYDRRHGTSAQAYEATLGIKVVGDAGHYLDASVTQRRFFESDNQLATIGGGLFLADTVTLDLYASALRTRPLASEEAINIYDLNATLGVELGRLVPALEGVRAMAAYQAFFEPDIFFSAVFAQLGYRYRG